MNTHIDPIVETRQQWVTGLVTHLQTEYTTLQRLVDIRPGDFAAMNAVERESFSLNHPVRLRRIAELQQACSAPLFRRITVQFDDKPEPEIICIGKFSSLSQGIYSWYAPVGVLRDAVPGPFAYARPHAQPRTGIVIDREDIHIVDGIIKNITRVESATERTVIYDSFIAEKKSDAFALPEIIEELEAVQNNIIQHNPRESVIITGPAGSGKTTLALHKLAYTLLNPDSAGLYQQSKCIVLVADNSAVEYFKALLITLGVPDVRVVAIFSFVQGLLGLDTDTAIDTALFDYPKLQSELLKLAKFAHITSSAKYEKKQLYTRSDAELQLLISIAKHGQLLEPHRVVVRKNGFGEYRTKLAPCDIDIIVIDEFQNYHHELLQTLIGTARATICSGADNQKLFIHSLATHAPESMTQFTLPSSYRNKKVITDFIQRCGWNIDPSHIPGGSVLCTHPDQLESVITDAVGNGSVSVISAASDPYTREGIQYHNPITVQGLQFTTTIVLIDDFIDLLDQFQPDSAAYSTIIDALYVSLTRPIDRLVIVSRWSEGEVVEKLKFYQ